MNCEFEESIILLPMLLAAQLVKEFPELYETRRFITVFTASHHWALSSGTITRHTVANHFPLRTISLLIPHPCIDFQRRPFTSFRFPNLTPPCHKLDDRTEMFRV